MAETANPERLPDPRSGAGHSERAMPKVVQDAAPERARLGGAQSPLLNGRADAEKKNEEEKKGQKEEEAHLRLTQKAFLNIFEDAADERLRFADSQSAMLNVLEDAASEQARLADMHRAMLNILEDVDAKNNEIEAVNRRMEAEIVTRRQAEDSLRTANKESESFSYSVSHDLRAPLRSIDGFSQALVEDCADRLDAEGKDYLARIRGATQRMALLIDELLKLSRISRTEMRFAAVDLSAMVREIVSELRDRDHARTVQCVISDGVVAEGDSSLLRIALENLLANAWKFTGKTAAARIEFGAAPQGGRTRYFVRDNGAGFDPAYVQKLFGAFQRLHSDAEFPGVGVGLAIVQRVILRHGGRVWADGTPEKGATFSFTLHESRGRS
jgi:light-regulated signal transduction histidine kinase (bacteriophytochrome)